MKYLSFFKNNEHVLQNESKLEMAFTRQTYFRFVISDRDLVKIVTHIAKKAYNNVDRVFNRVFAVGVIERPWKMNDRVSAHARVV